jgi:hypothetical protein
MATRSNAYARRGCTLAAREPFQRLALLAPPVRNVDQQCAFTQGLRRPVIDTMPLRAAPWSSVAWVSRSNESDG